MFTVPKWTAMYLYALIKVTSIAMKFTAPPWRATLFPAHSSCGKQSYPVCCWTTTYIPLVNHLGQMSPRVQLNHSPQPYLTLHATDEHAKDKLHPAVEDRSGNPTGTPEPQEEKNKSHIAQKARGKTSLWCN